MDAMAVVPKSQRPELLMSFSPVPELPGVPDKLQLSNLMPSEKQEESPAATRADYDDLQLQLEVEEDESDEESLPDPIPTAGKKRRQSWRDLVNDFLEQYGFEEIDRSQRIRTRTGCFCLFSTSQVVYPVHLAARDGNFKVLALLLKYGVDKNVLSSKGRTPLDMARSADVKGSHVKVINLLEGDAFPSLSVRRFWELL
eukprot:symbB.v1.2.015409.t1/scaffold1149.1/size164316/12